MRTATAAAVPHALGTSSLFEDAVLPNQSFATSAAAFSLTTARGGKRPAPAGPSAAAGRLDRLRQRLVRYHRQHGAGGLLVRLVQILWARALRPLVLVLFYYPAIIWDAVRWHLRQSPTVLQVEEGDARFDGGRHAVFVLWQPERTPWYVLNALRALAAIRANVLIVANHPLDKQRLAELRPLCARILIRDNTGLDMGAYKDAIAHLAGETIDRLLLLNDSIYYFESGLVGLFERLLASRADLCASHENVQFTPHLQSFCLSVSGRLARSDAFQRFWSRYVPAGSRRWAIHKGEIGLSSALLPEAGSVEVIYQAQDLSRTTALPSRALAYLPIPQRLQLALAREPALSPERLAALLTQGSQIHTGGFLFRQLEGAPLLKRDLVFRQQFTADEAESLLRATGHEGHLAEIMADLTRKGPPPAYGTLRHAKWAMGLI
jgi:hypothetical protein